MSIDVRRATAEDRDRWNDLVEQSPQGTPFHLEEFGEVVAEDTGGTYDPLIGFKGQEPVGLFPVHRMRRGFVPTLFSPPPNRAVTYQGPALLNTAKLTQRKVERRHRRFVEGCLDLLEGESDPRYLHVRTGSRYHDTRPFISAGFEATPAHTYVVDIAPEAETLLSQFSSDARQNVTSEYDGVEVTEGDERAIGTILDQVRARHEQQGEPFHVTPSYVTALSRRLPEGVLRSYVCRIDGDIAGGMITLELGDTIYRWLGGAKHDADAPVNDLVDWHVIRDAKARDLARYDLVGANERGIAKYKAKFAPELELYQQLERATPLMRVASTIYGRLT